MPTSGLSACLSCSQCDFRCPAEVQYTELVLNLREMVFTRQAQPDCPHGGALQSVMRMMATGGTQQNRLDWLSDDLKTEKKTGKVFFLTGCTMYYDAFFPEHELKTLDGTRATVKVLNALGIEPVVSPDEGCCGHDLLWNGDRDELRGAGETQRQAGGRERRQDAGDLLCRVCCAPGARTTHRSSRHRCRSCTSPSIWPSAGRAELNGER